MKISIFLLVLSINYTFAQSFSLSNQNHYGTSGLDGCFKAVPTNDGGYLVLSSISVADNDHSGVIFGNQDAWLIKLDAAKQIEWEKVYGGTDDDLFSDFILLNNGNILLSGHSNSPISGNKTVGTNGFYDYWILMLDSIGNILWQKNFGTDQNDQISQNSLLKLNENQFIVGGVSGGGINGDKTDLNKGIIDMWFVKFDSTGSLLDDFSIGGDDVDYLGKFISKTDGKILILSSSYSGISGDKNSAFVGGDFDCWIVECDTNGVVSNQNYYGGTGGDGLNDVQTNGSEIILVGVSDSPISGNKTADKLGNTDGIIIKMNLNLDIISEESYGGIGSWSYLLQIDKLINNKYIISGVTRGATNAFRSLPSYGLTDMWLFGTDENLNYEWNYSFGGDSYEYITELNQISSHEFDFFGTYESSSFSGDLTVPNYGMLSDILYTLIDSDLFIKENKNKLTVYPNPTTEKLFISTISNDNTEYFITNINGQKIVSEKYNGQIDVSFLSEGVYFLTINNEQFNSTIKFIKN